jgi:hypothetical protein
MRGQAKVESSTTMETSIKENGRVTNITDLVCIHGKAVPDMKVIG